MFELSGGDLLANYLKLRLFATKQMVNYMFDAYSEHLANFDNCMSPFWVAFFSLHDVK